MLRIGLIGCGRIGNVHAISIAQHPECKLSTVYDPMPENARTIADRVGASVARDLASLLADDVDAVVMASPTALHRDQFLAAARAGKPIFGEKPIDNNLTRARETVIALKATGTPVMIGFNRRFDRDHAQLRAEVQAGRIGRVQSMQLASRGPNGIPSLDYLRGSGGFYRDKCVHFLDLIRWISGEEPVDILAMGSVLADPSVAEADDVDTAAIVVRLRSGALAHIDNARRAVYGYDDRIEVFGTGGVIESSRLRSGNVMRITGDTVQLDGLPKNSYERYAGSYVAAFGAFVDLLQSRTNDVPTLDDGLKAQMMAEAATISAAERRIVRFAELEE